MLYTEHLMFRNWDPAADTNFILTFITNDPWMAWTGAEAPRPSSQEAAEAAAKNWAGRGDGLPALVICERPAETPQESLSGEDNLFVTKEGKSRYPAIGMLNFFAPEGFQFTDRVCKLGIMLEPKHRGQGLATEVIEFALKYGFDSLALHKLEADMLCKNTASRRLFEKFGFEVEGTRKSCFWLDGKYEDALMTGLVEDQWRSRRA